MIVKLRRHVKPPPPVNRGTPSPQETRISEPAKMAQFPEAPLFLAIAGYVSYLVLIVVGYVREFIWGIGPVEGDTAESMREKHRHHFTPLFASFESFYTRNVYRRLKDTFGIPICSVPGAQVELMDRTSPDHLWTMRLNPEMRRTCINLASYNYLGFAENRGLCIESTIAELGQSGGSACSSTMELGRSGVHEELEEEMAHFLGVEEAFTVGMGFATNSLNLPQLVGKGCLVLSDEKNHASLILGLRLSKATIKVFKHNNMDNLERILRKSIISGHPRTRRPFRKVLIVVEGVYSMEGSIANLPALVGLKRKYGAYLYVDEAHSIGALGHLGKGVVDYYRMRPQDVDILMGTFSKSFGGNGGYIAGSKELVSYLRVHSQSAAYGAPLSAPVARQILSALRQISNPQVGARRLRQLAKNTQYFRCTLQSMGFIVYGHPDSPVVPLMIFLPAKLKAVVNGLLDEGVASVGVGFPATPITEERVRFCMSSGHTQAMLEEALAAIKKLGHELKLSYY